MSSNTLQRAGREALWAAGVLLAAVGVGGCASTAGDIAAGAAPVAVHSGLHEANQSDDQRELSQLASSPAAKDAGRNVAAAATPVVVRAGLHEANTPESKDELQHLIDSPAFQHAGRAIGEGVGIGLFNQANQLTGGGATASVSGNAAAAQGKAGVAGGAPHATTGPGSGPTSGPTSGPVGTPAAAATPGGAAVLGLAGGGGGMGGLVHSSIQEAFMAATDPQFKEGERALSESVGEGFLQGMIAVLNKEGPELSKTIRTQLGPIVRELIREQIAPAVHDMIQQQLSPAILEVWRQGAVDTVKLSVRPDIQPDVIQNAQNASLGASRGTHDALVNAGLIDPAGGLSTHVRFFFWAGLTVGLLIVLLLLCLLVTLNLLVLRQWRARRPAAA